MLPFTYLRATDQAHALARAAEGGRFLAGGTTLVDLMRLGVERPAEVVDLQGIGLAEIEERDGGLRVGARVTNAALAAHPIVRDRYAALSEALLAGASPQIRNMATVGGNLLQRTRCPYFRDASVRCNKKEPGSGCPARDGFNRSHAVLGGSEACIASNPSDMAVALVMLGASVRAVGPGGERSIPVEELHTRPLDHPEIESTLAPGELITHVDVPPGLELGRSTYVKVRDRASFAFALASAAVALRVEDGVVRSARVALGGVATKPWRSVAAEQALVGAPAVAETFTKAGKAAMVGAEPRTHNAFKVRLGERVVARALELVGGAS